MNTHAEMAGWMIQGFDAWVALWAWTVLVLVHAFGRSLIRPAPDRIRVSGPVD
jgi:hypothetical protein